MEEYFKVGNPEGKTRRQIFGEPMRSIPAFREPGPRLELMDELGIYRSLMFPTLASLVEERMRDDPELIHEVVHALNSILVRPAPVPGFRGSRSFALPEFDPFWKRVSDAGVLVAMHSSDSGYARYAQEWEGSGAEMLPFVANVFRMVGEWRPVTDAVASWVCHGALFRHPELKVAVIENGSSWLVPMASGGTRRSSTWAPTTGRTRSPSSARRRPACRSSR
jgi:hypothetical protein